MVIDGSGPTAQELENEAALKKGQPITDTDSADWPLGTRVSKLKLLGTVLDKELSWDAHFAHRCACADDADYHVRQLAQHKRLPITEVIAEAERTVMQSMFYGAAALTVHKKRLWKALDKRVARTAALALGLHPSVTPEMGAHSLQYRSAQHRVERLQMRLLWELQHTAPRKTRRVFHELERCDPGTTDSGYRAWHTHARALQARIEQGADVQMLTATKLEWARAVDEQLESAHAGHWHRGLSLRVQREANTAETADLKRQSTSSPLEVPSPAG